MGSFILNIHLEKGQNDYIHKTINNSCKLQDIREELATKYKLPTEEICKWNFIFCICKWTELPNKYLSI